MTKMKTNIETVDDLRTEYKKIAGKEPAIRWNKTTLRKKITDHQILQAGYAEKERADSLPRQAGDVRPEFEVLAGETRQSPHHAGEGDQVDQQPPKDGRGGPREGAGRPIGQTDERARVQRLMSLEVPDLGVFKIVQGLNLAVGRLTGLPFTRDQCSSIALGVTLPLYYWFPAIEGASNKWTLHLTALEYIGTPIRERVLTINQLAHEAQRKEAEHGQQEENQKDEKANTKQAPDAPATGSEKKRAARSGSRKKQRH